MADIVIRRGRDDERALVLQSFVRTYRGEPYAHDVPEHVLSAMMTRFLDAWGFDVVVHPEVDEVMGFCVHSGPAVAWVQVKRAYRRRGVGRALLLHAKLPRMADAPFMCHRSGAVPAFFASLDIQLRFRPWMVLSVA